MSGISKAFKWGAGAVRIDIAGGKPLYLGKGGVALGGRGATCHVGPGVYLSPGCVVEVLPGASLILGDGVYMNDGCRVVIAESVEIGAGTIFGPDVKVYDHDHAFDADGVHGELLSSPVSIGGGCWLCANSVVTCGVRVADRCLVSAGAVVTRLRGAGVALRRRVGSAAEEVRR
jgi:acetyltransferase-like isoleucine patch superfamily enzyme